MTGNKKNDITFNFNNRRAIAGAAKCFKEYLGKKMGLNCCVPCENTTVKTHL